MKCPDCGHPDISHNDAGCFHDDGKPCFCRTSGESIRFPEQYERSIDLKDAVAWHYSIPGDVLSAIAKERQRQNEKWGEQNHPAEIWLAILSEELGEVSQALLHNKFGGKAVGTMRAELVQVAAVAVQWLECIDRNGEEIEVFMGQSDLNEDD
jgi:NTP pyrophosphatase (non-canonical NTP hydrolase)